MNIETGIPIPPSKRPKGRWDQVLKSLGIGNSIFFEDEREGECFRRAARFGGYEIVSRKVDGGWRFWRTA